VQLHVTVTSQPRSNFIWTSVFTDKTSEKDTSTDVEVKQIGQAMALMEVLFFISYIHINNNNNNNNHYFRDSGCMAHSNPIQKSL
jgi:hypothetical protein